MPNIADNLATVQERIAAACDRAGRAPEDVQLVAVGKKFPAPIIREAAEAGLTVFGENRVQEAKAKATAAVRAGVTGEAVHQATIDAITAHDYPVGPPPNAPADEFIGMVHGTGHGIGLDVHEPPLLDLKGPTLVVGDVLTIEPGLYGRLVGGVRIEDMVAVTEDGCENFNTLHEGLCWT